MSYVRLKHALAEIALDAVATTDRAPLVATLAAYGRLSRRRDLVLFTDLAHDAGVSAEDTARLLGGTGLFDQADSAQAVALKAPLRPFASYLRRQTSRLQQAVQTLRSSHAPNVVHEIWLGTVLFNAGLFFECHEYLEDVWRAAAPPERAFYHGLVQAAAGCYHLEKGNYHGARTLVAKAVAKLSPYAPAHLGVDVAALISDLGGLLRAVDASPPLRPRSRAQLPIIRLIRPSGAVSPFHGKPPSEGRPIPSRRGGRATSC